MIRGKLESGFGLEGYEAPDDIWYTKQKELEHHEKKLLEAPPQQQEDEQVEPEQDAPPVSDNQPSAKSGIFGAGTLAALQAGRGNGTAQPGPTKAVSSGLGLGAYDDDDDDGEW